VLARILIVVAIVLFLIIWARTVWDVLTRRPDLSVLGKIAWSVGMLVFPLLGILVYTMLRPADSQVAERARR
jgi:hypothetical protein